MPALSSLAVGSAPADRAGLAGGTLNSARQAGGAFGVAVLGSLLARSGARPSLYVLTAPMLFAGGVLFVAAVVSWIGTRDEEAQRARWASLNA
jgi:DHA2 family methylenomycin A resistance protein-like MFS transporter